jgi:hypothetical protein
VRAFAPKVAIVNANGFHVRYVHADLARAMVDVGTATVIAGSGRVRSVKLIATAATHAQLIGPATPGALGSVRFWRRVRLPESGSVIFEFHPRSFDR